VPFRACVDSRVTGSMLRVLMLLCGHLSLGSNRVRFAQSVIADEMGASHQHISFQIVKLVKFGYLIRGRPHKLGVFAAELYVVFDEKNPPKVVPWINPTRPIKSVAPVAPVAVGLGDTPSVLLVAWRKVIYGLNVEYLGNENEDRLFKELSVLGVKGEMLASLNPSASRPLIGHYMQLARSLLNA